MPSGVTETITNVSGYYFKVTITIPEHSKPASRTLTIRANQPNGLDRELVQTVQQSASTYEFGIRENLEDSLSTSLTYSGWPSSSDSSYNRPVRVYSRKNGNQFLNWTLSSNVDWITLSGSGAEVAYRVAPNNSSSSRTGIITITQGESNKTCTLTIIQEAKINNFRLELSLNISNSNDQDTWGLFDTANVPHTSDSMYDMSLIREGIIVDSVEGKITVNSIQSTTKDRGVGDNVYVWAYNSARGLWLSIGNFRIEEGNNTHHWDVSWPT